MEVLIEKHIYILKEDVNLLSKNATNLLLTRYAHKGETVDAILKRVSKAIAIRDSKFEKELLESMSNGEFFPNSPAIRNAGRKRGCYMHVSVGIHQS